MKKIKFLILIFGFYVALAQNCELNPNADETKCYNIQFEKGKPITLKKLGKKLDLSLIKGTIYKDTFSNMPKTSEITIRSSGINGIEDGFLHALPELEIITIKINHAFPNITKKMFSNCCSKMKGIRIYDNSFKTIEDGFFPSIKSLEEIWIEKQKIEVLTEEYLRGLNKLKLLGFQQCSIKSIHPKAFSTLISLEKLDLSTNLLKNLPDNLFQTSSNLVKLQLSNNKLTVFTDGMFNGLTKLNYLDLTGNKVTYVKPESLEKLPSLKTMYLKFSSNCSDAKAFAEGLKKKNVDIRTLDTSIRDSCKQA